MCIRDRSLHYYGDLKSAMALCYDRVALYSREDSGLRITFDTNIRFREENTDLRQGDDGRLLLEPGETLMEIKGTKRDMHIQGVAAHGPSPFLSFIFT